MEEYKCEKCLKIFKQKNDLFRHQKRKFPCEIKREIIVVEEDETFFQCEFCKKKYMTKSGVRKHTVSCVEKKIVDRVNEQTKNNIINGNNNNINCNNTTNITNNIINNVVVAVDYSKENLADVDLMKILKHHEEVLVKFLYDLHCSDEKPEYYNVGVKNMNRYQAYVKQNGLWVERNKKEVMKELLTKISTYISDEHLKESIRIGLNKADVLYSNALKEIKNTDPTEAIYEKTKMNKMYSDFEYVLFNNKDKIFSGQKQVIQRKYNYQMKERPEVKNLFIENEKN